MSLVLRGLLSVMLFDFSGPLFVWFVILSFWFAAVFRRWFLLLRLFLSPFFCLCLCGCRLALWFYVFFLLVCGIIEALARRIPFKFGMPSRGPCGDPPRSFF